MKIHPTAIVDARAHIGRGVEIGPFTIIEPDVVIGDNCKLESRVTIKRGTTLGDNNYVAENAILGGLPQHVDIPEVTGGVVIGDGNTLREHVTVHAAMDEGVCTTIGNNNMMMVGVHVAHDCRVGNNVIIANNTLLAGHVTVGDRAFISGAVAVHQYTRIGTLAMVGGHARVPQDVPPYCLVDGLACLIMGLNRVGLRRAGFGAQEMKQLKKAYRVIFRSELTWNEILTRFATEFAEGPAHKMGEFLANTTRGILSERRTTPTGEPSVRMADDEDEEWPPLRVHAG